MKFPFFIFIVNSQFTSKDSFLLIRSIKNWLRGYPRGQDVVEVDRTGSWKTLQTSSWKKIVVEPEGIWAEGLLNHSLASDFILGLPAIWEMSEVSPELVISKDMQIHVIAFSFRNPKGDMHRGTGKSTCSYTAHVQTHTNTQRQKQMFKYISANSGMWENRNTHPNTQAYVNMWEYKHASPRIKM